MKEGRDTWRQEEIRAGRQRYVQASRQRYTLIDTSTHWPFRCWCWRSSCCMDLVFQLLLPYILAADAGVPAAVAGVPAADVAVAGVPVAAVAGAGIPVAVY